MHHTEAQCKQKQAGYSPASSQATQHSLHAQQGTVMQHIDEQQEPEPRYLNHGYVVEDDPFLQGCQLPLKSVLKLQAVAEDLNLRRSSRLGFRDQQARKWHGIR